MHISLAWLARHVDLDGVDLDVLSNRFTLSVAELEGVTRLKDETGAVVGLVQSATRVPDTKLSQCRVDVGGGRVLDIVCGAANVAAGQHVAAVLPGGRILGREVVARKVHGLPSEGVLASEVELGIGPDESGILVLGPDARPGEPLTKLAPIEDAVLEIDNKSLTHRPDLWGHRGIAREVAALFGRRLKPLDLQLELGAKPPLPVEIQAEACKRYCALGLRGFKVEASPLWLRVLLHRVGTRPISNVVDATNFAMLDLGNPLHAFDRRTLSGDRIVVRYAREGETLRTLDGIERALLPRDLVIADGERPVALAGIMGGEHSGIEDTTTDVLLEAANFDAATVRLTGQRLGLRTEASARFEKSLDPTLAGQTARAFARLLTEISPGTEAYSALTTTGAPDPAPTRVALRLSRVRSRLGADLSADTIRGYLTAIEFDVREASPDVFDVGIPSFRATKDITEEVDLIEEVGRCHGYNNIPPAPPPVVLKAPDENRRKRFERTVRTYLTQAAGLDEILSYSFDSEAFLQKIGVTPPARSLLENPISSDMLAMRTDLAPHLIEALNKNAQNYDRIGVFELGRVFRPRKAGELPEQPAHLAGLVALAGSDADAEATLFFELKGVLEGLLSAVARPALALQKGGVAEVWAHPSRQARIVCGTTELGYVAELHPVVLARLDRGFRAALFELDLDRLRGVPEAARLPEPPPQFPAIFRDFALVVPEAVSAESLVSAIRAASPLIQDVAFQSLYRGAGIDEGAKCLAWSVTFRHAERTLTDAEVQAASDALLGSVRDRTGGRLR